MKNLYIIKNNELNHFQAKNTREAIELATILQKPIDVFSKDGAYFTFYIDNELSEYKNRIKLEKLIGLLNDQLKGGA